MKIFRNVVMLIAAAIILYGITMYDRWVAHKLNAEERFEQRQRQLSEPKFTEM
jgi:hypothetical protein